MDKKVFFDLDFSDLVEVIRGWNEPKYRATQIWEGLYIQLYNHPGSITTIPKKLQEKLSETFLFDPLNPVKSIQSKDKQTTKVLFKLQDEKYIETVLMEYDKRRTLCISSQAGCAMGCTFCATGQMGFMRNLTPGEIVAQVLYFARILKERNEAVTNVVLMGMGEPFHNYDATMKAIDILNDSDGFKFGARRFTISTVGLVPAIERFTKENRQVNLAISLHSTDNERRSSMMPVNKRYPIEELIDACRTYSESSRRRITFEWALIQNVNDSVDEARKLANLLKGLLCHVNVIPLNPTRGFSGQQSDKERIYAFRDTLEQAGIPCTVRMRRGIEIQAGCGQLATNI